MAALKNNDDDGDEHYYRYENPNYRTEFLAELERFYRSQLLTDVSIVCGEENASPIKCHKLVLSALSPYFRAMFSAGFLETGLENFIFIQISHLNFKFLAFENHTRLHCLI